jgi:hypothetical protein
MTATSKLSLEAFLAFSAEVTAFTTFELRGTGQAEAYWGAVEKVVGRQVMKRLLDAYAGLGAIDAPNRKERLRREIFGDEQLGPIARNIIKLWYVGVWYQLPSTWSQAYGARGKDVTFMVRASAYAEGLLWLAIGANPPGAKAPGYGSWAEPPQIPGLELGAARSGTAATPAPSQRRSPELPVSLPLVPTLREDEISHV